MSPAEYIKRIQDLMHKEKHSTALIYCDNFLSEFLKIQPDYELESDKEDGYIYGKFNYRKFIESINLKSSESGASYSSINPVPIHYIEMAYYMKGCAEIQLSNEKSAIISFKNSCKFNGNLPYPYLQLGQLLYKHPDKCQESSELENIWKKLLELRPNSIHALYGLVAISLEKADYVEAETYYKRLIDVHPGSYKFNFERGENFLKINEEYKALKSFERAVEIDPTIDAKIYAALAAYRLDKLILAKEYAQKVLASAPANLPANEILIDAIAKTDKEQAISQAIKILAKNPSLISLKLKIASLFEENGEYYKALDFYNDYLYRDSHTVYVINKISNLYIILKKFQLAKHNLEISLSMEPSNEETISLKKKLDELEQIEMAKKINQESQMTIFALKLTLLDEKIPYLGDDFTPAKDESSELIGEDSPI